MNYWSIYVSMLLGALCSVIALTAMRRREKHNVGKFGWLLLILATPPVGLVLFLIFGGKKISAEHAQRDLIDLPDDNDAASQTSSSVAEIAAIRGIPKPSNRNRMAVQLEPESMYRELFDLIKSAKRRLLISTFILIDDDVGNKIIDQLCQKARDGVEVRLLIDGFGSFHFPDELLQKVCRAGGQAARFKPLSKISRFAYSNFRNHRKLVVADGDRAMVGGSNLVEYEMTLHPNDDTWIDYSLRIDGLAARQVEAIFLSDWQFSTGETLPRTDCELPDSFDAGDIAELQIIPVGPDGPTEILDDLWLTAINRSTDRVWIVTPYFVPPPMAMRSLAMAVRRGVDVRIIVPEESDMSPADYARYDYLQDLHELGVQVFRVPDKMVHAKMLLIDDEVGYVGSANFDMRSFFLNYELVVAVYNCKQIDKMASWFNKLANECDGGPKTRTWARRGMSVLTRVFAEEL